ncbi:MAG: methylenetetrahydrofolate reductase [NAD(P)H] [Planctomycetota bacterium]
MRLQQVYAGGRFGLSFEIFPPKTPEGDAALRTTLNELAVWNPAFISCTYGAGGSTSRQTLDWCQYIQDQHQVPATAHFTCVGSSRNELIQWLQAASDSGVRNIMALRGDAPHGETKFQVAPDGLAHASQLVTLIREQFPDMGIGVAGYPEKHPESCDLGSDLQHQVQKVAAGADALFTQLFFENRHFFQFRNRLHELGVTVPIVPGIMPITEYARIVRISSMCGSDIPLRLAVRLEEVQHDKVAQFEIGVQFAIEQCRVLLEEGIPGIHFYALNKSPECSRILQELELPQTSDWGILPRPLGTR